MNAAPEAAVLSVAASGPVTFDALQRGFDLLEPRWLAAVVCRLLDEGRLTTVGCDPSHRHDGSCVLAVAR